MKPIQHLTRYFAAWILALTSSFAQAAYPERAVTLVVTYPPGGTADTVARILAPEVAKLLGQPVVVENRGGAGGRPRVQWCLGPQRGPGHRGLCQRARAV